MALPPVVALLPLLLSALSPTSVLREEEDEGCGFLVGSLFKSPTSLFRLIKTAILLSIT